MKKSHVAIVGCGIFGAMTAIKLAESGIGVTIFDSNSRPLQGASLNNQNRLHLGFHYPRDDETASQCIRGFDEFRSEFSDCILDNFDNAYFIASEGSLTSPDEYLRFCRKHQLDFEEIDPNLFDPIVNNVDLGITTKEVVYDSVILEKLITKKFRSLKILPRFNSEVTSISKKGDIFSLEINKSNQDDYDAIVNCTYANLNQLKFQIGQETKNFQYEYTIVPIVDWCRSPVGITIMDGPFMTVLPFGKSKNFLLYHVDHTVIERKIGTQMPSKWRTKETSPSIYTDKNKVFQDIIESFSEFVPAVKDSKVRGFLETTRVVQAYKEETDARPSIIEKIDDGFISVFTAKIDHCMWVSKEISLDIKNYLGY